MQRKMIFLEFSEDEVQLIFKTFSALTSFNLEKWMDMIETGYYKTPECDEQWKVTGICHEVMYTSGEAIGIQVSEPVI